MFSLYPDDEDLTLEFSLQTDIQTDPMFLNGDYILTSANLDPKVGLLAYSKRVNKFIE